MVNEIWNSALNDIESDWKILLGKSYDTLDSLTKGKGIGDEAPNFLLDMYHPQELLKNTEKRNIIISVLRKNDAEELARMLSVPCENTEYMFQCLKTIKYSKKIERIFLNYFGINPVEKKPQEQVLGFEEITLEELEYPLRDYQLQVLSDLDKIFSKGSKRCIIHMPTGSGKTRTTMYKVSSYMNSSDTYMVLWLAYSKELCDQAAEEFSRVWRIRGNKKAKIYRFYGNSTVELPKEKINGIVITTLSKILSAVKKNNTLLSHLSNKINLIIFDEAHQIVAPEYNNVVDELVSLNPQTKLIGLTATPGRTWNDPDEDKKLSTFFYQNIASIVTENGESPNEMLTRMGYLSKIKWIPCDCDSPVLSDHDIALIKKMREEDEIPKNILEKMSLDVIRNTKIINSIRELLEDGKKRILVFSTGVEHARMICGLSKIIAKDYGCNVDYITGETDKGTRDQIIKQFKSDDPHPHILCNYNILTTGFDSPSIDAGIIARPTKSLVLFSQMVGRMIRGPRTHGGTEYASIVTMVDIGLPGFKDSYNNWEDIWS